MVAVTHIYDGTEITIGYGRGSKSRPCLEGWMERQTTFFSSTDYASTAPITLYTAPYSYQTPYTSFHDAEPLLLGLAIPVSGH